MLQELTLLLELQQIDLQIKNKELIAYKIPKELEVLKQEFEKSKAGLEQKKAIMEKYQSKNGGE